MDDAPGLVGIRYDLEQEPGAPLVNRHVAELVDDREPRPGDLPELRVEPPRFARRSRMSSPVAVKNPTGIARMHASLPNATARCVLPVPTGP